MFPPSLPGRLPTMVGRDRDLAALRLSLEDHRLVAVVGCGGVGKSRLAMAACQGAAVPALFVPLAAIARADLLLGEVVRRAGWAGSPSQDPLVVLADAVGERSALIVLDNVEQIARLAEPLLAVLDACPGVTLLTTTQVALGIDQEQRFPIGPLAEAAAVELLGAIASEFPACADDEPDAGALRAICAHLDNLPLAIELAGAQLRMTTAGELLGLLDQRLDVLRARRPAAHANQATLRAAVEWSIGLLSATGRDAFQRLAVFAGGFGLNAASAALEADAPTALDVLHELIEHQIVRLAPAPQDGERRFDIPETLRLLGVEGLQRSGEEEAANVALARWCKQRLAELFTTGAEAGAAFDAVEIEHGNMRAALTWLVDHPDQAGDDALWMVAQLRRFWWARTTGGEGRQWAERAIAAYRGPPSAALAEAWEAAGALAEEHGDVSACEQAFDRAILLYEQLGDQLGLARCLNSFGLVCRHRGDLDGAAELHGQALAIFEEFGDERGCVLALDRLAATAYFAGDLDGAAEMWERTLPHLRRSGDERGMATILSNLGAVMLGRGEARRALAAHLEVLRIQEHLGELSAAGRTQVNIGECHLVLGDLDAAERRLTAALEITRANQDRYAQAEALLLLGRLAKERGMWAAAGARMIDSFDLCCATEQHAGAARALVNVAVMAGQDGEDGLALALLGAADRVGDESTVVGVEADERQRAETAAAARLSVADHDAARDEGARWTLERARSEALALSAVLANNRQAPPAQAPPTVAMRALGLSQREAQVAELLARRFTDQEIATELFISLRTAGAHVSAVLRKLGVSSRRQVGPALAEQGVDLGT